MIEVRIPKMGMSTVEVDITNVLVQVGDRVVAGQVLAEVEAEKANVEIEAEASGVVSEVLVTSGEVRNVGNVILCMEEE